MILHQLQPSFNNGEISPLLYDRTDYNKFVSSLKSGKNMFVHPQGGCSNRAGTIMLSQAKDEKVRLIPFEFSNTETYTIEFGNGYCRFFTSDGQVIKEDGSIYEIESPFSTDDLDKIKFCQSGDVMYIAWGGEPKVLTRRGHTDWSIEKYENEEGPIDWNKEYTGKITKYQAQEEVNYLALGKVNGSNTYLQNDSLDDSWTVAPKSSFMEAIQTIGYNRFFFSNGVFFSTIRNPNGFLQPAYCINGYTWIRFGDDSLEEDNYVNGVAFYNGNYLLCTKKNVYFFSSLTNMQDVTEYFFDINNLSSVSKVYVSNNKFFVLIEGLNFSKMSYSTDGRSWVSAPSGYFCFINNKYYAVSSGYSNAVTCVRYDSDFTNRYEVCTQNYRACKDFFVVNNRLFAWLFYGNSTISYLVEVDFENRRFVTVNNCPLNWLNTSSNEKYSSNLYYTYDYDNNVFLSTGVDEAYKFDGDNFVVVPKGENDVKFSYIYPFHIAAQTEDELRLSTSEYSFTSKDLYKDFCIELSTDAISLTLDKSGTTSTYLVAGSWNLTTSGTWTGTVSILTSQDNENWETYKSYSSADNFNAAVSGDFSNRTFVKLDIKLTSGTGFKCLFNASQAKINIFFHAIKYIDSQNVNISIDEKSKEDFKLITNNVGKFYIGKWSPVTYYPTDVELYQDRIEWAANNEIEATKISNYTNFGISDVVAEDEAISVIIKDKKINKINTFVASNKLVVFTDSGNFVHSNDTFTPSTATFHKQGSTGGASVKPLVVRDDIIYVHPMRQAISDYSYNFETDGYAGKDITILATHLFQGDKIKEMYYQQEPYSIIWVLLESGKVLACTYLRQQDVIAWTPMDFGGEVQSICVLSDGTSQELYLAVKRNNGTFVEKMPNRLMDAPIEDRFFVDCGRTYKGEPISTVQGLDWLEGETVSVLADGNCILDKVVTNGEITLDTPASTITVGIPFESVLETLTFDVGGNDGSVLNRKKRVVAVSIKYIASRGGLASVNGNREINLIEHQRRTDKGKQELKTGFYREILPSRHDESANVKIRQILPLPVTITSVIPEIEYEQ